MNNPESRVLASACLLLGLLTAAPARAASLQKVADWGARGVPNSASMYIYVPDRLAAKPPILVLAHYCGGTASAVFGQAQGGGIVKAADTHGFIMVVPQTSKNCWDVGSMKSLAHDGGGDTQAVAQMVSYALTKYQGNAERVYITGDSSGGMLTEAMLAVYPELFKGGAAFAGVPAGCWAAGNPDGSWSAQCAGGQVNQSPVEWGDRARSMYPSYQGHRPRVQLFHGDADTIINAKNQNEAIEQWTNLLALSAEPTATDSVMLGSHQATRQRWRNRCGFVVLEAYSSRGGDHGPSDALFAASYVIPFLGLDNPEATDPEIAQCGDAGAMPGSGGADSGSADGGLADAATHMGSLSTDAGSTVDAGGAPVVGSSGTPDASSGPGDAGYDGALSGDSSDNSNEGCSCSAVGDDASHARVLGTFLLALFVARCSRRACTH